MSDTFATPPLAGEAPLVGDVDASTGQVGSASVPDTPRDHSDPARGDVAPDAPDAPAEPDPAPLDPAAA
jgi:hypothetical protein